MVNADKVEILNHLVMLPKCHDMRNRSEYEGALDVDDSLVTDLIGACRKVAERSSNCDRPNELAGPGRRPKAAVPGHPSGLCVRLGSQALLSG